MKQKPSIISVFATMITMIIGILVIIGWFIHNDFLRSIVPGAVKMKFNVALGFIFSSVVLLLNYAPEKNKTRQLISNLLSVIVVLIGLLTLVEYVFDCNLGIDEFFAKDELRTTATYYAGRMSPLSAINFVFIGVGLFLLNKEKTVLYHFFYLLAIAFISLLMLIGFNLIADIPTFIRLAIHVAIGFITLAVAIWFAQPTLQKKINFESKIFAGFTAIIILMVVISIFSSYYNDKRISTAKQISYTNDALHEAEQTLSLVKDIESGGRGYIITGDSNYLEPFFIAKNTLSSHLKKLQELTTDNLIQETMIDTLWRLIDKRIDFSLQCIRLKNEHNIEEATKLMATRQGKFYTDRIRQVITAIQKEENNLLEQRQQENDKSIAAFNRTFFIFLAGVFILLAIILFSILNNISIRKKAEKQSRENEQQIQTIFNAAPDAVIVMDEEGKIVKWNSKSEMLFGWSAAEVIDQLLADIIIPHRYREAHRNGLKLFLKTSHEVVLGKTIEIQALNKTGIEFDVALSISPTIVNDKYLFIGFIRDTTERKEAEEQIRKQRQEIQDFIDSMSTLCAKVDTSGKLLMVNKTATQASGLTLEQLLATNFLEGNWWTFDPAVHERVSEVFKKACVGIPVNYDEKIFVFGRVLTVNFSLTPIMKPVGDSVDYIVAEARDITRQKEAEEKIKESEHMFADLFYKSPIMKAIAETATGKYIEVNDAFTEFMEYPREEILGKTSLDLKMLVRPDDRAGILASLEKDGFARNIETQVNAKDGMVRWVSTNIDKMKLNGKDCYLTAAIDITRRKYIEEELLELNRDLEEKIMGRTKEIKRSEKRYRTIASSIPGSVICLLDEEYRYLLIEGDMLEKLGYSKDKLLGNRAADALQPGIFADLQKEFKSVFEGKTVTREVSSFGYDVISRFIPLKDDNDTVYAIMTVTMDVTELKNAQRNIAELNRGLEEKIITRTEELKKSNEEMEAFSYSVSHDLRAPLRGIIGFATILEEEYSTKLDDEARRITAVIKNSTIKMGNLIDDLLTFSRMGRQDILKATINTQNLVADIIADLEPLNNPGTITWKLHYLSDTYGDINTIKQVWINLISNAIKYSRNAAAPFIEIGSFIRNSENIFFIKDNGVGFDTKYGNKLFKVFQRLHGPNEFEGTGVGLAIVEKIVSRHGGRVWGEAEIGKGASFYFSLPEA